MTAQLIDGRALANQQLDRLGELRQQNAARPVRLLSLEVGEHPAASVYLRNQQRAADRVGIEFEHITLPRDIAEAALLEQLSAYNADPSVTGVLIQRPLPVGIDPRRVQGTVGRRKDVEGMNPANMGAILYREPRLAPCTALAAVALIESTGIPLRGAEVVVVGHSEIVGKPVAILLLHHLATVTVCHVGTKNLIDHTRRAEVLIVAVGRAGLVHGDMVRDGAIVIDIGINSVDGKLCGDVDFPSASEVAGHITPVPGGVGPVTVAMLMRNALRAAGIDKA